MNLTDQHLAPYAARSAISRGRLFIEPASESRSEFQRDRDRIIHCSAFRRLEYKTQVFLNHEGDLFRTRLTHSLEVAQIGRSIARNLRLNEDLVEAIALAHDLGHTPFGHAGQDALNACMQPYGGFEHNLQSLRVVDHLEERYAAFDGLNLCFETREGILKHCSQENARQLGDVGQRFIHKTQPTLEAQLTNLADEIAYNNHDIDDGLRSGLITEQQIMEVDFFGRHRAEVRSMYPDLIGRRAISETIRRMINTLIVDLMRTSLARIQDSAVQSPDAVRQAGKLIAFSAAQYEEARILKHFLHHQLYRHYQVNRMMTKAKRIIHELFDVMMAEPKLIPPDYQVRAEVPEAQRQQQQARKIADYIAGMTDRYAIREHKRLFSIEDM
ncbi:deoxyguanosinetriphosphate triphosphohydrolase [Undibacterium oligocarboniphilum]|uniref:Deoxyguanosinetriphosphate triphosphohydrolase-like protein n=1 Tax=Undibacterium oligocarboniphilum TaxID=666702 RepID=A0A850QHG4_9BURK|nr:deoxyguanosinetriphosphate triphosphohydrolase [Undibacterium oligocarboniphilum]MBC3870471.1 deoxyguanosinetriphosphate triphosphohydrolase [Undibacterium oligocarboniphilum]NVO78728.1 deoxyguanosinetriphosphate triphosphohydrolase [Undibacterium oligocarboniphilum]